MRVILGPFAADITVENCAGRPEATWSICRHGSVFLLVDDVVGPGPAEEPGGDEQVHQDDTVDLSLDLDNSKHSMDDDENDIEALIRRGESGVKAGADSVRGLQSNRPPPRR